MVKLSIDKKLISSFPIEHFDGKIVVVDTIEKLDVALRELNKERYVGIDTETRPAFKKGTVYSVSLIQLSTHSVCYLVRVNKTGYHKQLLDFLENKDITKIGLSLCDDIKRINASIKFKPGSFLDLQSFVKEYGIIDNGLSRIFAIIFEHRISKGQQLTNWEADTLTEKQQLYAATDAWACVKIYDELKENRFNPNECKYVLQEENDIL